MRATTSAELEGLAFLPYVISIFPGLLAGVALAKANVPFEPFAVAAAVLLPFIGARWLTIATARKRYKDAKAHLQRIGAIVARQGSTLRGHLADANPAVATDEAQSEELEH